jgi:hypothetical protein
MSRLVSSLIIFFLIPQYIAAKTLSFTAPVNTLQGEQEVVLYASPSGFSSSDSIYIKGAFYKEGSSNYFGYTKIGDSWVKNSASTTNQRKITMNDWDGILTVKPDFQDTGFSDNGSYLLKLGFYTVLENGDTSSVKWSTNTVNMNLEKPPPTPTTAPTSTHIPTVQLTAVPTRTPTILPTIEATIAITKTLKPTHKPVFTSKHEEEKVLGETIQLSTSSAFSLTPTPITAESKGMNIIVPFSLVGIGTAILTILSTLHIMKRGIKSGENKTLHE